MKCGRWIVVVGVLTALLSLGSFCRADDPIGRISFGGSGGFSSYALQKVNDRINGDGAEFLESKDWEPLDEFTHGWTFWTDLRIPLPLGDLELPIPFLDKKLPIELSIAGGIGTSSGSTTGPDTNELLEIEGKQSYYHGRLLYTLPFRPMEDVRMFLGGGPIIITDQELTVRHTARDASGGGTGTILERTEEVTYSGDGLGWQLGFAVEYMAHDYITIAFDMAYRWAKIDYGSWSPSGNVKILDTVPVELPSEGGSVETTNLERLFRENSYVFHGFLDWEATELRESAGSGTPHSYGPYIGMLQALNKSDLDIDMSGVQVHLGFRFYFL